MSTLKLLATIMPQITEELYLAGFTAADGARSIHVARWPSGDEAWASAAAERDGQAILAVAESVRRWKAERQLSVAAPLTALRVTCPADARDALAGAALDLRSVTRARRIEVIAATEWGALDVAVQPEEGPSTPVRSASDR